MTREVHKTSEVFVVGAQPDLTYNPRDGRQLEQELDQYLDQSDGQALSVYGPTKSGKTVLVKRKLVPEDQAVWIPGASVKTVDDLWYRIADELGLATQVEVSHEKARGGEGQAGVGVDLKVVSAKAGGKLATTTTSGVRSSHTKLIESLAWRGLKDLGMPLVIDDFHYASPDAVPELARAIKSLIEFCKVIMIAVPHEASTAVRNESDMGGRVRMLEIEPWSEDELQFIAERGFSKLNVVDEGEIGATLARHSFGAPFLMQDLCREYVLSVLKLKETASSKVRITSQPDWPEFLYRVAKRMGSPMFEMLLAGPGSPRRREPHMLRNGDVTDVYGVVLYAVAKVGKAKVSESNIDHVINRDFETAPSRSAITTALSNMSKLAMDRRGNSDPAVAYKNSALHIMDPFLLLYLCHGRWDVAKDDLDGAIDPPPQLDLGGDETT